MSKSRVHDSEVYKVTPAGKSKRDALLVSLTKPCFLTGNECLCRGLNRNQILKGLGTTCLSASRCDRPQSDVTCDMRVQQTGYMHSLFVSYTFLRLFIAWIRRETAPTVQDSLKRPVDCWFVRILLITKAVLHRNRLFWDLTDWQLRNAPNRPPTCMARHSLAHHPYWTPHSARSKEAASART